MMFNHNDFSWQSEVYLFGEDTFEMILLIVDPLLVHDFGDSIVQKKLSNFKNTPLGNKY